MKLGSKNNHQTRNARILSIENKFHSIKLRKYKPILWFSAAIIALLQLPQLRHSARLHCMIIGSIPTVAASSLA
jgi:hypothetical protein